MDATDIGSDREQEMRDDAIAEASRAAAGLPYTGCCHNCGDITGGGRRFCGADCRDDYDARARITKRQRGR